MEMPNTAASGKPEENCSKSYKTHVDPKYECPICLQWLHETVLTSCGHKFCSKCIYAWLEKKESCCPVDSRSLKHENDLFRDLHTDREISQIHINCPYQQFGCEVELSPVDMNTHIDQCTYKTTLSESQTQNTDKGMSVEAILWDPPQKSGAQISNKEGPTPDWQQLLKNLYERIVVLEQANRELSITVSNQKSQLETMYLQTCNGFYIWRLKSFQEKLAAMKKDHLQMFYSPAFYTSPYGYKICARINISSNDENYLSLLLHIMKSDNDDALDWPFNGIIYFVLVHPLNSDENIREITLSRRDLESFWKPACELNKRSFGYTEFVHVDEVLKYVCDDEIIFRIEVHPDDKFKMTLME
ncbi:TNF receptor-associated factor 6 [Pseudomyrmex gracilis]|uniref:TNF receptor-associated factor 6 n=1 Tax=Pseudomyrmex gracilis TaxID=219809 RepID=UPI000995C6CF|nr:TNF receptor-associated factor 6 [Pseudomyrmex gracilis]XP_020278211.1 TNF receptor-associated factor 6 [Pseudomyrmex gracilis]XP_020278212.1 TNF receptor-associated factor 6 [Pseudomyrmex gracilis]XP_020278213.1 TNF receptor-associated factor 6 [Pseudomyrmex gracilis]